MRTFTSLRLLLSLAALAVLLSGCGSDVSGVPGGIFGGVYGSECFRAVRCVRVCGGEVLQSGCLACPGGSFDDIVCARDAAADASGD